MSKIEEIRKLHAELEKLQDEYDGIRTGIRADDARMMAIGARQRVIFIEVGLIARVALGEAQTEPKVVVPLLDGYPEHTKLRAISDNSQVIGEFLEWVENEEGMALCDKDNTDSDHHSPWWPTHKSREKLLAMFFDIDLDKIEAEKRAMLDEMRG